VPVESRMSVAMDVDAVEPMEEDSPHPSSHQPFQRRSSMSETEERQRRASIRAIMTDKTISEHERRCSIQHLMDGRRSSMGQGAITPPETYGRDRNDHSDSNFHQSQGFETTDIMQDSFSSFTAQGPVCNEVTKRSELTRPVCTHYARNCTMIAPCCGAAFGCRICHDESPVLPPKIVVQKVRRRYPRSSSLPSSFTNMNQAPEDNHHEIDRFAVKEVICRQCFSRQNSKT
jgi:CHY zinc finger